MAQETKIPGIKAQHVIISDTCRTNRSDYGAWIEAVARLYTEYLKACAGWPLGKDAKLHFVLTVERPTKFVVYDGEKLARYPECKVHKSWANCHFHTFEDACIYVHKWLGNGGDEVTGIVLKVNEPYEYNEGSFIIIKKE